jgi:hypothetical protein
MNYEEVGYRIPVSAGAVISAIYERILNTESPDAVLVLAQAARVIAETAVLMEPLEANSISISNDA